MKSLATFLDELDEHVDRIPLGTLEAALRDLALTRADVAHFVKFSDQGYRRNLMHEGHAYQALVLCWKPGQRSPIHDHRGSSCGVKVIEGVAVETVFERTKTGMVYATVSHAHVAGSVCATQDADIHQVSNLSDDGGALVTLHVYSPPLLTMGTYSLYDTSVGEFTDPVFQDLLLDGAGI